MELIKPFCGIFSRNTELNNSNNNDKADINSPCYYIYQLNTNNRSTIGLLAATRLKDVNTRILPHEKTLKNKRHTQLEAFLQSETQLNPVLIAHKFSEQISAILKTITEKKHHIQFNQMDSTHLFWVIHDDAVINQITNAYEMLNTVYVADGHHRIAAMTMLQKERGYPNQFLSYLVSSEQLKVCSYNRLIYGNSFVIEKFINAISDIFFVAKAIEPKFPQLKHEYLVYIKDNWLNVKLKTADALSQFTQAISDSTIIDKYLIPKVLNLFEEQNDDSVGFIPNIYSLNEIQKMIDKEDANAIVLLPPLLIEDLYEVADKGLTLPPNTSWFEPKLLDGLLSYTLFERQHDKNPTGVIL